MTGVLNFNILKTPSKQLRFSTYLKFVFSDRGAQLEDIIFMELLRRGYQVTIGRSRDGEIDVVATFGASREYVQVTLSMLKEFAPQPAFTPSPTAA
ncbi:hypothetical protein [Bifidobacterium pullorum]|uniref:hypothetical protein n=1 Tax=Bifidobacterium pullorum TaxID=78448 RepID=UPI001D543EF0|nr:hypothetical protein [Bifidobacterium pullorum]HJE20692.1 hypothetical protein [Bifidobacterium pullorum]